MRENDPAIFFSQKAMCSNCPFRADDSAIALAPGRLREIADRLIDQPKSPFFCHKSAHGERIEPCDEAADHANEDFETRYSPTGRERYCIGAMAHLHRAGHPNLVMVLGHEFGLVDRQAIEATIPQIKLDKDIG